MQLNSRCTTLSTVRTCGSAVTSRRVVLAKAQAGDDSSPFAGLMRIFTPNNYIDSKEDWEGTGSGYQGKISRGRKPFKDGYTSQKQARESSSPPPMSQGKQQFSGPQAPSSNAVMDYLSAAAQRVVGNNFTGDESEPDWGKLGSGARGWSGDVKRGRKKI